MFSRRRQGIFLLKEKEKKLENAKQIKLKTFFFKFFRIEKTLKY